MAKIQGKVSKFGSKGYGFIDGEDGNKYFAHQKNIDGNSKLKIGSTVTFKVQESDKGLVAIEIKETKRAKQSTGGSSSATTLLTISFILHAITIYAVFFK